MHLGDGERREALPRQHELVADGAADACVERLDALLDAVLRGGDEFGGGGRRGGAQVGDEVRDGEVGLVADGGDDRQRGGGNGAGERLVVESGEVFQRASAARDEDEIDLARELVGLTLPLALALLGWIWLNQRMPAATEAAHSGPCTVAG